MIKCCRVGQGAGYRLLFKEALLQILASAGNPFELKHHFEISLIKHIICGSVAEGSKVLDLGSSLLGGVGSNLTTASQ